MLLSILLNVTTGNTLHTEVNFVRLPNYHTSSSRAQITDLICGTNFVPRCLILRKRLVHTFLTLVCSIKIELFCHHLVTLLLTVIESVLMKVILITWETDVKPDLQHRK